MKTPSIQCSFLTRYFLLLLLIFPSVCCLGQLSPEQEVKIDSMGPDTRPLQLYYSDSRKDFFSMALGLGEQSAKKSRLHQGSYDWSHRQYRCSQVVDYGFDEK